VAFLDRKRYREAASGGGGISDRGMFRGSGVVRCGVVGFLSATKADVASTKAEVGR
jgi:hypothetical protein